MSFATLTLDFGASSVLVEPRYVMALHPVWLDSPQTPDDPHGGRLVTRLFFATGMQLDVVEGLDRVAASLIGAGD